MGRVIEHPPRALVLLGIAAGCAACGGGTRAELDRVIAAGQAREARSMERVRHRIQRERSEAESLSALVQHLDLSAETAGRLQAHGAQSHGVTGLVDPATGLCALVLRRPSGLEVYRISGPRTWADADPLWMLTVPGEGVGEPRSRAADHDVLTRWASGRCREATADSPRTPRPPRTVTADHAQQLQALKQRRWEDRVPDIVLCDRAPVDQDALQRAVERWRHRGEAIGRVVSKRCRDRPDPGEIAIYVTDTPPMENAHGVTRTAVYLDEAGARTTSLAYARIWIRSPYTDSTILLEHELGHGLGYADTDDHTSIMARSGPLY